MSGVLLVTQWPALPECVACSAKCDMPDTSVAEIEVGVAGVAIPLIL